MAPDTPIEALAGYRMELHCCGGSTTYPLSLLAQSLPQGGRTPLAAAIGLFRCERCRQPTREAMLVEQDGREAGWRVEIVGRVIHKAASVQFIEENGGGPGVRLKGSG